MVWGKKVILAAVVSACALGACVSVASGKGNYPTLEGFSVTMSLPKSTGFGTASFGVMCKGIDSNTRFSTRGGDTTFDPPDTPTPRLLVDTPSSPGGWSLATDPAVKRRYPTHLLLVWPPASNTANPNDVLGVQGALPIQAAGALPSWLVWGSSADLKRPCPATITYENSPLGRSIPIKWSLGSIDNSFPDSGCGYVAISGSDPAYSARILLTSSAGAGYADTLPGYECRQGRAVPVLPVAPDGFTVDPLLGARASLVARKQVSIACSDGLDSWDKAFDVPGVGTTIVGGATAFLFSQNCADLRKGMKVGLTRLAASVSVLAHMAEHMRGIATEHDAACATFKDLPLLARAWGIRDKASITKFVKAARADQSRTFFGPDC